jgi:hypothetical protein
MKGTLLIVKPHLLEGMGLDTERYAKRHMIFRSKQRAISSLMRSSGKPITS